MSDVGPATRSRVGAAIAGGSVVVGVLDLAAALLIGAANGTPSVRVLQSIASGAIGRAAYDGGSRSAALGLALHFGIAAVVSTVYILASRRWPMVNRRPWLWGGAYGVLVFLVMYRIVLPIAGLRVWPLPRAALANALLAHLFAVGIPLAFWARRSASRR